MNKEFTPSPYVNSREKRALDLAVNVLLMPVIIPTIGALAVAIKLEDGDPVLFKQERIGKDGNIFTIYKLRTMDEAGERTRIGKIIRPLGLDELPQIWNILKGEMSSFGIRMVTPEDFERTCNFHLTDPDIFTPELIQAWKEAYLAGRPGGLSRAAAEAPSVFYRGYGDLEGIKRKMEIDIEQASGE